MQKLFNIHYNKYFLILAIITFVGCQADNEENDSSLKLSFSENLKHSPEIIFGFHDTIYTIFNNNMNKFAIHQNKLSLVDSFSLSAVQPFNRGSYSYSFNEYTAYTKDGYILNISSSGKINISRNISEFPYADNYYQVSRNIVTEDPNIYLTYQFNVFRYNTDLQKMSKLYVRDFMSSCTFLQDSLFLFRIPLNTLGPKGTYLLSDAGRVLFISNFSDLTWYYSTTTDKNNNLITVGLDKNRTVITEFIDGINALALTSLINSTENLEFTDTIILPDNIFILGNERNRKKSVLQLEIYSATSVLKRLLINDARQYSHIWATDKYLLLINNNQQLDGYIYK